MNSNNPEKIRSFIGIQPNNATMAFLQSFKQQHGQDSWVKFIRWTAENNIHLTMRFLGDLIPEQIEQLKSGLEPIAKNQAPFSVTVTTPRPFPTAKKARILAAQILKSEPLEQLANNIDTLAISAGVAKEDRPFRGHLTVGRFRSPMKHLNALLQETATTDMVIDHIILFKSLLKTTGAEYFEMGRFWLGNPE
jgi:2'-5' RNA ligase